MVRGLPNLPHHSPPTHECANAIAARESVLTDTAVVDAGDQPALLLWQRPGSSARQEGTAVRARALRRVEDLPRDLAGVVVQSHCAERRAQQLVAGHREPLRRPHAVQGRRGRPDRCNGLGPREHLRRGQVPHVSVLWARRQRRVRRGLLPARPGHLLAAAREGTQGRRRAVRRRFRQAQ